MILEQNYLEHHGIKWQKWGVLRFQNRDGSLTDAGRARYGVSKSANYNEKIRTDYLQNDHTIPKGTEMYRVTPNTNEDEDSPTYATYINVDRDIYNGYYSNGIRRQYGLHPDAPLYELQMHSRKPINVASDEAIKDAYTEVLSDEKVLNDSMHKIFGETWKDVIAIDLYDRYSFNPKTHEYDVPAHKVHKLVQENLHSEIKKDAAEFIHNFKKQMAIKRLMKYSGLPLDMHRIFCLT